MYSVDKPAFIGIYPVFMLFPNSFAYMVSKKNALNVCLPAKTCFPMANQNTTTSKLF